MSAAAGAPASPGAEAPTPASPTFHDFSALTISGERREMSEYRGQLVLVVNTATRCAFTPQLEGLQQLQVAFGRRGFTVLGFPSDQFHQDPGTDEETEKICTSAYDITFPLFSKIDVNGEGAHPLWRWMATQQGGVLGGRISWNFTKFLIDADGQVLRRFAPPIPPARIARRIEHELGIPVGTTTFD
jgi:glutathione peroxidase